MKNESIMYLKVNRAILGNNREAHIVSSVRFVLFEGLGLFALLDLLHLIESNIAIVAAPRQQTRRQNQRQNAIVGATIRVMLKKKTKNL